MYQSVTNERRIIQNSDTGASPLVATRHIATGKLRRLVDQFISIVHCRNTTAKSSYPWLISFLTHILYTGKWITWSLNRLPGTCFETQSQHANWSAFVSCHTHIVVIKRFSFEKLIVAQLVTKFAAFYGTWRFVYCVYRRQPLDPI